MVILYIIWLDIFMIPFKHLSGILQYVLLLYVLIVLGMQIQHTFLHTLKDRKTL